LVHHLKEWWLADCTELRTRGQAKFATVSDTMDTAALFRERLRQLILERYPSLDRFYLESGLSKGHVSEILRGVSSPSVSTLIKLAEALEVEVKDFFLFPEVSRRHHLITLVEICSEERLDAVQKLLTAEMHPSPRKKR
jgi:transcriptional regulator with XRE-family HTH domain